MNDTALAAYRLRWHLDDLGLNLALFRSPHDHDANTAARRADLPRLADDIRLPADTR